MLQRKRTDDIRGLSYNLDSPDHPAENVTAMLHNVMPRIDTGSMSNSLGVIESGNVSLETKVPDYERKSKKKKSKVKRKK